jgi:hypothetical protein
MFNSPGVWDEPHSGRPTEPRLFKIAHFASDLDVELMTATAISALRSSSSRDGIGRPTALSALAARGVVDVNVLSDQALLDAAAQDRQAQCNDGRQPLAVAT